LYLNRLDPVVRRQAMGLTNSMTRTTTGQPLDFLLRVRFRSDTTCSLEVDEPT